MRENGIFLTFMAFLLASTVLALAISASQAESRAQENLALETAFTGANNRFGNIMQQASAAKEGNAGMVYSRMMPFSRFRAGENWVEITQETAYSEDRLKKTYDALNLFAVFAEEKGGEGLQTEVKSLVQDETWGGDEEYPKISYIVLPQCLKFSAGGSASASVITLEGGTTGDGCRQDFDPNDVESQEAGIALDYSDYQQLHCGGAFSSAGNNCADQGDSEQDYYAEIKVRLENCGPSCNESGFDQDGLQIISGNLSGGNDYIQAVLTGGGNFRLEFQDYVAKIVSGGNRSNAFTTKIVFTEPFDEIVLAPGQFDFSVKNTGFGICRATSEEGCAP